MMQGYLAEPALCFAAVGDALSDQAPLQVTDFSKGKSIDQWISKLWLEGGGGANNHESYELAAFYLANHVSFPAILPGTKPFLFFTGDEGFYKMVPAKFIRSHIDPSWNGDVPVEDVFAQLRSKYHVFLLHKPFHDARIDEIQTQRWREVLGPECVLELHDPKAVVDVMLGAIALVTGRRDMEHYMVDLTDRGQTKERQQEVRQALESLAAPPTVAPAAAGLSPEEALRAELEAAKKVVLVHAVSRGGGVVWCRVVCASVV